MKEKEYLTAKGVADYLGVKPIAIYGKVQRKQIPYRKINGQLFFIKSEIDAWIKDGPGLRLEDLRHDR